MKKSIFATSFIVMVLTLLAFGSPAKAGTECFSFSLNLGVGSSMNNTDTASFGKLLYREGLAASASHSNYFDENDAAAIVRLQGKYGITQTGYFGPRTREKVNAIYGCSSSVSSGYPASFDIDVSTLSGLTKKEAIRQMYVALQHREPDQQGWDYWVNYNTDYGTIKALMVAGIEYQSKMKIISFYEKNFNRMPTDAEMWKWYEVMHVNNFDFSLVEQGLLGSVTPTPTYTYTPSPSYTYTPTPTKSPSYTPTLTPTYSPTPTPSNKKPTVTATVKPTTSPSSTYSPTPTYSTPAYSVTPKATVKSEVTSTPAVTPATTPTPTVSNMATLTTSPTPSTTTVKGQTLWEMIRSVVGI